MAFSPTKRTYLRGASYPSGSGPMLYTDRSKLRQSSAIPTRKVSSPRKAKGFPKTQAEQEKMLNLQVHEILQGKNNLCDNHVTNCAVSLKKLEDMRDNIKLEVAAASECDSFIDIVKTLLNEFKRIVSEFKEKEKLNKDNLEYDRKKMNELQNNIEILRLNLKGSDDKNMALQKKLEESEKKYEKEKENKEKLKKKYETETQQNVESKKQINILMKKLASYNNGMENYDEEEYKFENRSKVRPYSACTRVTHYPSANIGPKTLGPIRRDSDVTTVSFANSTSNCDCQERSQSNLGKEHSHLTNNNISICENEDASYCNIVREQSQLTCMSFANSSIRSLSVNDT